MKLAKYKSLFISVLAMSLIILGGCSSEVKPQGLTGYKTTEWGMSKDEIKQIEQIADEVLIEDKENKLRYGSLDLNNSLVMDSLFSNDSVYIEYIFEDDALIKVMQTLESSALVESMVLDLHDDFCRKYGDTKYKIDKYSTIDPAVTWVSSASWKTETSRIIFLAHLEKAYIGLDNSITITYAPIMPKE